MGFRDPGFDDRKGAAAAAKQSLLQKFKAKSAELEATRGQRDEKAQALREAREVRLAQRESCSPAATLASPFTNPPPPLASISLSPSLATQSVKYSGLSGPQTVVVLGN